jgi:hypothetical protein
MFLKILNGRLTGDSTEPYSETVIDAVLKAITNAGDNRIMNKIIMTQKKQYYTIHEPDKLLEFINDNLKPKVEEKKQKGEVFTPIYLVREMLEKLDNAYIKNNDKSIFSEPTFKWFDPAVGIGNFPIIVYLKLMIGLKQTIIVDEERRKHILENMLYMSELTLKNVLICRKIFCSETYKLNLYKGDTLKMDIKKEFKLPADFVGFDVIMGNPPYQGSGRKKIYINFIELSITQLLKLNGNLIFLTPKLALLYLLGGTVDNKTMTQLYNILYINTSNTIKSTYFKNIGSDFIYFIIQNNTYNNKTTIMYDDDTHDDIIKLKFNSILDTGTKNNNNNIVNKLIKLNSNEWKRRACRIEQPLVDHKTHTHINKIIYKLKTLMKDDVIKWTSKTHPDMNKYKVLWPTLGDRILIDNNKNLFPGTSFVVYIACHSLKECENIKILMNSKLFKYLEKIFKTYRNPRDFIMRNLIKPGEFNIAINNDKDIYKYFNLSQEDIHKIDLYITDKSKKSESKEEEDSKQEEEPEKSKEEGTLLPEGKKRCPRGTRLIPKSNPKRCTKKTKSKKTLTKSLGKGAGRKRKKTLRRRRRSKYTTIKKRRLK